MTVWAELQTIDACIGLATFVVRVCRYAIRYKNAGQIAEQTKTTATEVCNALKTIKNVLAAREDSGIADSFETNETCNLSLIEKTAERCKETLHKLVVVVYGKDVTDYGAVKDEQMKRAKVAFSEQSIASLKADLDLHLNILQLSLVLLQIFDNSTSHIKAASNHSKIMQELKKQHRLLGKLNRELSKGERAQQPASQESSRRASVASTGKTRDVSNQPPLLPTTFANGSFEDLDTCMRNAKDVLKRLTEDSSPSEESDITGSNSRKPGSSAPERPTDRSVQDSGPNLADYPLDLIQKYIAQYKQNASSQQQAGCWLEARGSLEKIITYSEQAATLQCPFKDKVKVYEKLVVVLLKLNKWNEALDRVAACLESNKQSPEDASPSDRPDDERIQTASFIELKALILFNRWLKSQAHRAGVRTLDLETARQCASSAFVILRGHFESSPQDASRSDRYRDSGFLLADICYELGDKVEAEGLREDISEKCGPEPDGEPIRHHSALEDAYPTSAPEDVPADGKDVEPRSPLSRSDSVFPQRRHSSDSVKAEGSGSGRRRSSDLHHAAASGNVKTVRKLLENDAQINAENQKQETPLLIAVKKGFHEVVQELLGQRADTRRLFKENFSILHCSVRLPAVDITVLILQRDASPELVNAKDTSGWTALHYCADNGWVEQARALLRLGAADVHSQEGEGRTPLQVALQQPSTSVMEAMFNLLLDYGAQSNETDLAKNHGDTLQRYMSNRRRSVLARTR